MSSIVIAGDTSGSVTLQAPAVAGSTVLNLPSTSGTIQTSGAGYTTNGVAYATSTSALSTGSALTFDGTNFIHSGASFFAATTGNVGVGTNSPDAKLRVVDSAGNGLRIGYLSGSLNYNLYDASVHQIRSVNGTTSYVTIDATGLGIGTSSPAYKLNIIEGKTLTPTTGEGQIAIDNSTSGQVSAILFSSQGTRRAQISAGLGGTGNDGYLAFTTRNDTTGFGERARFDSSGNLLVGTTSSTGSASNTAVTISGAFQTASGSVSAPSSTATAVATLPNVNYGTWIVCIALSTGVAATWSSTYVLNTQGTSSNIGTLLAGSGSGLGISMSGLSLRVQQGSGATQTIYWSITRIF